MASKAKSYPDEVLEMLLRTVFGPSIAVAGFILLISIADASRNW